MKQMIVNAVLLGTLLAPAFAQPEVEPLRVGIKDTPPFVMFADVCLEEEYCGISADLWVRIAEQLELDYTFVPFGQDQLADMLDAIATGDIDVAVGALTITASREELFDFSHSFYTTGLGIAVPNQSSWVWLSVLRRLFSVEFAIAIASLCAILLVVSLLIWLFERHHNSEHFSNDAKGIGSGFWWSAVTMTTVGYGDKAPKTLGGRIIAFVWMFASLIMISGFTAAIATALTVDRLESNIRTANDLDGLRVGVVGGSSASETLRRERLGFRRAYDDARGALAALEQGQLDAVVHDQPLLQYLVTQNFTGDIDVLSETFERQDYGLGLIENSSLREDINRELLAITGSDEWQLIRGDYLGDVAE